LTGCQWPKEWDSRCETGTSWGTQS